MTGPSIVCFRDDLRIADNPALQAAAERGEKVLAVFILDEVSPDIRALGGASKWWLHHSLTALTASLMPPEVMSAMQYASRHFVNLISLQDAVGARIAQMLECESAMVTSGAAGALTIGTAA